MQALPAFSTRDWGKSHAPLHGAPEDLEDEEAGAQPGGGRAGSGGLCDLGTDRGSRSSSEGDSMTIASAT